MYATYSVAIVTLLSLVSAHKMEAGACPKYESNMPDERFNFTRFGGLWFEYLLDPDFKEE